ncbi:MOSC domain-containing protein [bacterium]|nr:MOSC domain-containing protein [bacterium]
MGSLEAICISVEKGTTKSPVPTASLQTAHGIVGDAHAGSWHRQVSLLALESIDRMRALYPAIEDGAFAENLITSGIDWRRTVVGDRVRIGEDVLLEVTQIGKECHQGCIIREKTGDCIMPREGIFCSVLTGGVITPGDGVERLPGAAGED